MLDSGSPQFDFEKYRSLMASAWEGHELFAYNFVRNVKPRVIVELGTFTGFSFFVMAQAVKDAKLSSKLFAIDTWEGDKHTGFYDDSVYKFVKGLKNRFYAEQKIKFLRKTFKEANKDFRDNSIDLLHIDGLHTYKAVKGDFEMWLPKMNKNGVIFFHDIAVPYFGVRRFWAEIEKKYPTNSFSHSYGLGIIFLGKVYQL